MKWITTRFIKDFRGLPSEISAYELKNSYSISENGLYERGLILKKNSKNFKRTLFRLSLDECYCMKFSFLLFLFRIPFPCIACCYYFIRLK